MTDRELLEAAAKAAGVGYGEWTKHGIVFAAEDAVWNPLTDDGDALRLAVKLGITTMFDRYSVWCEQYGILEKYDGDPLAAARRAIVRAAAAEIGRSME